MIFLKLTQFAARIKTEKIRITAFLLSVLILFTTIPPVAFAEGACICPDGVETHWATCPLYSCPDCGASDCYGDCPDPDEDPGTGDEPDAGEGDEPDVGEGDEPGTGEGDEPGTGEGNEPGTGEGDEPGTGEGNEPGTGEGSEPGTGEGDEPGTGEGNEPDAGEGDEPGTGEGNEPGTGEGDDPSVDPDLCDICGSNPCTCPDYVFHAGKIAGFNPEGYPLIFITEEEPDENWTEYYLEFYPEDFSEDVLFQIDAYKVVTESVDEDTEVLSETSDEGDESESSQTLESLWYQVHIVKGSAIEDFADGSWIFQNYLDDDPAYDTLLIGEHEKCPVCGEYDCETEHIKCPACGEYDCETEHIKCPACGEYDCEIEHIKCDICDGYDCHHTWCGVCGELDCETEHIYCPICRDFDCGLEHEPAPEKEPYVPPTEPVIPENPVLPEEFETLVLDENGNPISVEDSIILDWRYKTSLSAWCKEEGELYYQWQIYYDAGEGIWVDISGQTGQGILVSHTMLRSVLDDENGAWLRCMIESDANDLYSDPIRVIVDDTGNAAEETTPEAPEEEEDGPILLFLRRLMAAPRALLNSLAPLAADDGEYVSIIINYWDAGSFTSDGEKQAISSAYKASVRKGTDFPLRVITSPRITGYAPYWETDDDEMLWTGDDYFTKEGKYVDATGSESDDYSESADEIKLEFTGDQLQEDIVIDVYYLPVKVNVAFRYYFQNLYNDNYTEDINLYHTRTVRTGTVITNEELVNYAGDTTGFTRVYHPDTTVAADGSTVFHCYYDRNYYLSNFYLDGGHGVTPVYARYGTPLKANIDIPVKNGYKFAGWDLLRTDYIDSDGEHKETNDEDGVSDDKDAVPETVDTVNRDYKALWQVGDPVPYTVVYWRENADPEPDGTYKYSVWGSATRYTQVDTYANGEDDVPTSVSNAIVDGATINEKKYFTFNEARTDKNVLVKGDGSTFVNVYYTRNTYTIQFTGFGKCAIPEHTHGTGCNPYLICGQKEHSHDATCGTKSLSCGMTEHTAHTNACCNAPHVHTKDCYQNVGNEYVGDRVSGANPTGDGYIYRYQSWGTTYRYIYIGGKWYSYNGTGYTGNVIQPSANLCSGTHVHNAGNCNCTVPIHTHNEACYTYSNCDAIAHEHDATDCYYACTLVEHTHNTTCSTNNLNNVIYVLTAKYNAAIGTVWPTVNVLENNRTDTSGHYANSSGELVGGTSNNSERFYGWDNLDGTNGSSTFVTKRINLTASICDAIIANRTVKANYDNGTATYVFYLFESIDQTSDGYAADFEKGTYRVEHSNGKYYESDPAYFQQLSLGSNSGLSPKEILGMTPISTNTVNATTVQGQRCILLYYNRNGGLQIKFLSRGEEPNKISNLKFGEPMEGYVFDENGKLYEPPYPSTLEPNAYAFKGWYSTSNFIPGTEADEAYFRSDKAVMPNNSVEFHAKWEKVDRKVNFFFHYEYLEAYKEGLSYIEGANNEKIYFRDDGENKGNGGMTSFTVTHGETLDDMVLQAYYQLPIPDNAKVYFVNWFYIQDGQQLAYSPGEIPVRQDLNVYAEWRTELTEPYRISYVLNGTDTKIAEDTFGYATVGTNMTFQAKVGAPRNEMLDGYNKGYFPLASSHTISIRTEMGLEPEYNTYSFKYVKAADLKYTVRYVTMEDGVEHVLGSEEIPTDNSYVIVRYKEFEGYAADEFYKDLVLSVEPDPKNPEQYISAHTNVITFYYTKSEDVQYMVHHMIEKLHNDGDPNNVASNYAIDGTGGYANYDHSTQAQVKKGEAVSIVPLTNIPGFAPAGKAKSVTTSTASNGSVVKQEKDLAAGGSGAYSVKIEKSGTEIYIFYTRQKYSYSVEYLDYTTHVKLGSGTGGTALYGSEVSATAPKYIKENSYERVSPQTRTIEIREDAAQNVIIFYYDPIVYEVNYHVLPVDSPNKLTLSKEVINGSAAFTGSGIITNANYEFDQWYYKDAEGNIIPVTPDIATVDANHFLKPIRQTDADGPVTQYNFYAKFNLLAGDFTIIRRNATPGQVFVYQVRSVTDPNLVIEVSAQANANRGAEVVIKDLPYGEYTVEQVNNWSWQYTTDKVFRNVMHSPETPFVEYEEAPGIFKWLTGIGNLIRQIWEGLT